MNEDWQAAGFGIYVHWPFCQSKCPYCDFNSHVRGGIDHARWARALVSQVDRLVERVPGRKVDSIFFGGGTPSLMAPATVADVIAAVRRRWDLSADAEITLEANPGSVERARFRDFAAAGVNRVSVGVQSLVDADLKVLGRLHTAEDARRAFDIARTTFGQVSFDLIYGRQHQTRHAWRRELREALEMAADHLSLYMLTIEAGTRFGDLYDRGRLKGLPDDDRAVGLYEDTQDLCARYGLGAYEISNHARPGSESRHNLIYWRYGDYGGIGPGAHGRLTIRGRKLATVSAKSPEAWLDRVERTGSGDFTDEPVPLAEQAEEYAMMSLRLTEGMSMGRYSRLAGRDLAADTIARLAEAGLVALSGDRLKATAEGRLVLNAILRELLGAD